jgi:type II secretory pathway component PulM
MNKVLRSAAATWRPMWQRYQLLPARERGLLLVGSLVVAGSLVYGLAIAPMERELERLRVDVASNRVKLATMRAQAKQLDSLRAAAPQAAATRETLRTTLERSSEERGLRGKMRQPQDNSLSVQFVLDDVEADVLFDWLEALSTSNSIRARSVQIDRLNQPGRVKATLIMRGATP